MTFLAVIGLVTMELRKTLLLPRSVLTKQKAWHSQGSLNTIIVKVQSIQIVIVINKYVINKMYEVKECYILLFSCVAKNALQL